MANSFRMVDDKLVQLTDAEQKELNDRSKEWEKGKADRELAELRTQRNTLLSETDWWDLSDTPDMTDEQKKYRQDLRDITKTYSSLDDVKWPTKPE